MHKTLVAVVSAIHLLLIPHAPTSRHEGKPVLYDHVEQKLWDWVPITVDNIDLRQT